MDTFFPHLQSLRSSIALVDGEVEYTYLAVGRRIQQFAVALLNGKSDLNEERIATFIPASADYVIALHGIWRAGGIALPMNTASAILELEYYLTSTGVTRLITVEQYIEPLNNLCSSLNIEVLAAGSLVNSDGTVDVAVLPDISLDRRMMILFTSGTTNKPKGVVTTRRNIEAQIKSLVEAWEWSDADVIPLFLPLHHIHGIINILSCALWAGATVHLYPTFDMRNILKKVSSNTFNVFMAVPTVYVKIIKHLEAAADMSSEDKDAVCKGFQAMRLNISGSASCPISLFEKWVQLTGQVLLERYGMTEIGMALSNPYGGKRMAGAVGTPLPGVEVGLFDENNAMIAVPNNAGYISSSPDGGVDGSGVDGSVQGLDEQRSCPGEIRVKGDTVFLEYWSKPDATAASFKDGWFCTGDIAAIDLEGYYHIMGRNSVDIIKSGGYKLSALEIEGVLLTHEMVAECAVIGIPDEVWGESVVAFVVLKEGYVLTYADMKMWCTSRMSSYKIPKTLCVVTSLPRNAMGKVMKPELKNHVA
jgi:malonyl-CoA/methylmalonyl-CoA synthetase